MCDFEKRFAALEAKVHRLENAVKDLTETNDVLEKENVLLLARRAELEAENASLQIEGHGPEQRLRTLVQRLLKYGPCPEQRCWHNLFPTWFHDRCRDECGPSLLELLNPN